MEGLKQFDVFRNPDESLRDDFPYLVAVSHDFWSSLDVVAVVPRRTLGSRPPLRGLEFVVDVGGAKTVFAVYFIGHVARRRLKERVANLEPIRHQIIGALDAFITGF